MPNNRAKSKYFQLFYQRFKMVSDYQSEGVTTRFISFLFSCRMTALEGITFALI